MIKAPRNILKVIFLPASTLVGYTTYRYFDSTNKNDKTFDYKILDENELAHASRYDSNYFKSKSSSYKIKQAPSNEDALKSLFSLKDTIKQTDDEFKVNSFDDVVSLLNRGPTKIFDHNKTFSENLETLDSRLRSDDVKAVFGDLDTQDIKNNTYSSFIQFFKIMYLEMLKETDNLQDIYQAYRSILLEVTQNSIYEEENLLNENKESFISDLDVLFSSTLIKVKNSKQMDVLFSKKSLLSHIHHFDFSNVDESFKLEDCPTIEHRCTFVFKHSPKNDLNQDLFSGIEKFSGLKELVLGYASDAKSPRVSFAKLPKNVESLVAIGYRLTDSDIFDLSKSQIKEIVMSDHGTIFDFSIFSKIKTLKCLYIYNSSNKTNEQYFESKFKTTVFTHPIRIFIKKDILSPPSVFILGEID